MSEVGLREAQANTLERIPAPPIVTTGPSGDSQMLCLDPVFVAQTAMLRLDFAIVAYRLEAPEGQLPIAPALQRRENLDNRQVRRDGRNPPCPAKSYPGCW